MSTQLMSAAHISIDTSFKQVHGKWQEFEIETWDPIHMKCKRSISVLLAANKSFQQPLIIIAARAFTTSQSSSTHLILFTRIFEIAMEDTGRPVQFHHIHGAGFQTWIADAHKGQALGLDTVSFWFPCYVIAIYQYWYYCPIGAGLFCQKLCSNLVGNCPIEPGKLLRELSPYDHLRRFFRLCTVHFKRNIQSSKFRLCRGVFGDAELDIMWASWRFRRYM